VGGRIEIVRLNFGGAARTSGIRASKRLGWQGIYLGHGQWHCSNILPGILYPTFDSTSLGEDGNLHIIAENKPQHTPSPPSTVFA
jgi:hypothetical protein